MTTLSSTSSPELSGSGWIRVVALYGVGPLLAVLLVLWLTKSVDAQLERIEAKQADTSALVGQHITATHDVLERIAKQLEASCKIAAHSRKAELMCEVGR